MPLDAECQALLEVFVAQGMRPFAELTPAECREVAPSFTKLMGEREEVAGVEDREAPGPAGPVPVRVYTPAGAGPRPLPVVLYLHGGGFVFGDPALTDSITRTLANRSGCLVVSVDYRLAPEHPFPTAPEDVYAALLWVAQHAGELGGDPERVAVCGDSAGGNLSAVVSLMARERGGPAIAFQALIYPAVDSTQSQPSYQEHAGAPILSTADVHYFWDHYFAGGGDRRDPRAAPLQVADLSGLPPALIVTAEVDPLRDEAEEYGRRLSEAGVKTEVCRYDGVFHGFFWMPAALTRGVEVMNQVAGALAALRQP